MISKESKENESIAHHYGYEEGTKKTVLISTAGLPNMKGNFVGFRIKGEDAYAIDGEEWKEFEMELE